MKSHTFPAAQLSPSPASFRRSTHLFNPPKFQTFSSLSSSYQPSKLEIDVNLPTKKSMFIFGMGYVAQYFAQELINEGWDVAGTCTSITKKRALEQKGFDVHVFNAFKPEWKILDRLRCSTHLLVSVPPSEGIGDPILQHEEAFKDSLVDGNLQWLCYLSTTSIYGDAGGAWVDENFLPKPSSQLAKMRLESEKGWLNLGEELGLSTYVFRLGGIYGPGRSAIDTLLKKEGLSDRQKKRVAKSFTSRVHVADICQALKASISMWNQRKIYNIVDDDPAPRAEVFAFARQLIDQRWPGLIDMTDNNIDNKLPGRAEKRVSNALVKNELRLKLLYPSYRSGLQSIIDNLEDPTSYCDCKGKS